VEGSVPFSPLGWKIGACPEADATLGLVKTATLSRGAFPMQQATSRARKLTTFYNAGRLPPEVSRRGNHSSRHLESGSHERPRLARVAGIMPWTRIDAMRNDPMTMTLQELSVAAGGTDLNNDEARAMLADALLCGQPHNRAYVANLLMWRPAECSARSSLLARLNAT
jgi:hypothetical protein